MWTKVAVVAATISQTCAQIEEIVIKSVLCGLTKIKEALSNGVKSTYNMYKILGFDILLDCHRQPHLIEINSRPNCHNNKLDAFVNRPMVTIYLTKLNKKIFPR